MLQDCLSVNIAAAQVLLSWGGPAWITNNQRFMQRSTNHLYACSGEVALYTITAPHLLSISSRKAAALDWETLKDTSVKSIKSEKKFS